MSLIKYETAIHRGKEIIFIRFAPDVALNAEVKRFTGSRWSQTCKAWYVPDTTYYRRKFNLPVKTMPGRAVLNAIHPENVKAIQRYVETLQLKAYSLSTITTYRNEFAQLLYALKGEFVDDLTPDRLRGYFCTASIFFALARIRCTAELTPLNFILSKC